MLSTMWSEGQFVISKGIYICDIERNLLPCSLIRWKMEHDTSHYTALTFAKCIEPFTLISLWRRDPKVFQIQSPPELIPMNGILIIFKHFPSPEVNYEAEGDLREFRKGRFEESPYAGVGVHAVGHWVSHGFVEGCIRSVLMQGSICSLHSA